MGVLRCDSTGIFVDGTYPHSGNLWKKIHLDGITNFLMGCYVFIPSRKLHWSNKCLSQKTIGSYVRKSWDEVPYSSYPLAMFLLWCRLFLPPWCWWPLAPTGAIATASPNQSTKTSSEGLRQCCPCLILKDSKGGASSIVLTHLVHFCLFYFSPAPPLYQFCPACIDDWRAPSPSCFPSPSSLLLWHHCCITLALPELVRRYCPFALASSMLST